MRVVAHYCSICSALFLTVVLLCMLLARTVFTSSGHNYKVLGIQRYFIAMAL